MTNDASTQAAPEFNQADVTFATMMIPHHEQAVTMSDIVLEKAGVDPEVTALATQIKAAQAPEIALQQRWLKAWGVDQPAASSDHGAVNPGAMNPGAMNHVAMPGMLSERGLDELRVADGATASVLFLQRMIAHHEGALAMARTEVIDGLNTDAVALAREIVTSQSEEIERMRSLLTTISK